MSNLWFGWLFFAIFAGIVFAISKSGDGRRQRRGDTVLKAMQQRIANRREGEKQRLVAAGDDGLLHDRFGRSEARRALGSYGHTGVGRTMRGDRKVPKWMADNEAEDERMRDIRNWNFNVKSGNQHANHPANRFNPATGSRGAPPPKGLKPLPEDKHYPRGDTKVQQLVHTHKRDGKVIKAYRRRSAR